MKHISILVPETAVPATIVDPRYMFTAVNQFFREAGHQPFFDVSLVGLTENVKLLDGLITIHPERIINDVEKTDLIIIPAISGDVKAALELNEQFIPWIVKQYKEGVEVASLCVGAFMLGATGLLNGKTCSTHWLFANDFREMFPEVELEDDKVVTEHEGIYSSGGASSYWNLLLYLIEKYTSREMSIVASKFFLLDIARKSQSPFAIFRGQKEHEDREVIKAQEYIETHFDKKIHVQDLADYFGIGRRTFERRFKKATTNTVVEYIQRVRVEAAKKMLEAGRKTVNEVMYEVGYNDPKAFRDVFRKIAGLSPMEYQEKFK
jgi:transcriptional regulator GlxA family with amidase domain